MMFLSIFCASFLAFSISTICGGGAGLLLIPILGFWLPVTQVPTALTLGTATSSVSRIWLFFEIIRWDIVKLFLPTALVGVFLGSWLLNYLAPMYLELCMGIFLVSNLPYFLGKSEQAPSSNQPPPWLLRVVGFLAGFISGLTGAVGVLFNRFYFRYGLSNEQIIATRAANEALLHLIKLYLYASLGLLTVKAMQLGLIVAIAALLSSNLMKLVIPKLSKKLFARIGYGAMVISGVLMLNSSLVRIKIAHDPDIRLQYLARGLDASFSWNSLIYSLEFKYEEGFEFEKIVPLSSLPPDLQDRVHSLQAASTKIIIEKVYTLTTQSYEAYYYDQHHNLTNKIKLKQSATYN
jgi:hypothetical protein